MAISRMQEPQQIQSGIGSLQDPRQGYFLGKLVKKAGRAVKKIVKSPLGKMALIGGLGYGLGGAKFLGGEGIFKAGQTGRFGNLLNLVRAKGTASGKPGIFSSLFFDKDKNFSLGRTALTGLAGTALAAPFFMGDDEEEEVTDVIDVGAIRNSAANYYSGLGDKGAGLSFMPQKQFVQPNFYAAAGGRAMLNMGGESGSAQAEQMLMAEFVKYKNRGGTLSFEQFVKAVMQQQQAPEGAGMEQPMAMAADGGRIGKQEGGIMETETSEMIDMGGMEKDYRNTGGFVEIGGKEKADDVPARLSKNEFVFTADAVRNAGGGDIDKGAEVMENLMNNLEAGGEVSEDSQGLEGAQAMYDQQQMLQSRMI
jgi:hypothetical protein